MVGQWREHEVVVTEASPQQAGRSRVGDVALEDAPDEQLGETSRGCRVDELIEGSVERRTVLRCGRQTVLEEVTGAGLVEGSGEQLAEQVHSDTAVAQFLDEGVVLLACSFGPHDVVEEQLVHVGRGEP